MFRPLFTVSSSILPISNGDRMHDTQHANVSSIFHEEGRPAGPMAREFLLIPIGFCNLSQPINYHREIEFSLIHRTLDEFVSFKLIHFYGITVGFKHQIRENKANSLIAVYKSVIFHQGFHHRRGFFDDVAIVSSLRAKDGGLQQRLIAYAVQSAKFVD